VDVKITSHGVAPVHSVKLLMGFDYKLSVRAPARSQGCWEACCGTGMSSTRTLPPPPFQPGVGGGPPGRHGVRHAHAGVRGARVAAGRRGAARGRRAAAAAARATARGRPRHHAPWRSRQPVRRWVYAPPMEGTGATAT
jgi:hypothetical protein